MRGFGAGPSSSRAMGESGNIVALRASGEEFPAEASISHTEVAGRSIFTVIMRDITARLAADGRIKRLSSLYAALSRTNEAIVRENDWHTLCETVCRIIVEYKQVEAAVIRMPDAQGAHLTPYARHGRDTGAFGGGLVELGDPQHPAAVALREHRPVIVGEMLERPERTATRPELLEQNIRSLIVVPLMVGEKAVGTLSVFAAEPGPLRHGTGPAVCGTRRRPGLRPRQACRRGRHARKARRATAPWSTPRPTPSA